MMQESTTGKHVCMFTQKNNRKKCSGIQKAPKKFYRERLRVARQLPSSLSDVSQWRWARRCVYCRAQERSGDTSLLLSLSQWRQGSARAQSSGMREALSWIELFVCVILSSTTKPLACVQTCSVIIVQASPYTSLKLAWNDNAPYLIFKCKW